MVFIIFETDKPDHLLGPTVQLHIPVDANAAIVVVRDVLATAQPTDVGEGSSNRVQCRHPRVLHQAERCAAITQEPGELLERLAGQPGSVRSRAWPATC